MTNKFKKELEIFESVVAENKNTALTINDGSNCDGDEFILAESEVENVASMLCNWWGEKQDQYDMCLDADGNPDEIEPLTIEYAREYFADIYPLA